MSIDRKAFYDKYRTLFHSRLTQTQVNGYEAIFDYWDSSNLTDLRWLAYVLATAYHETGELIEPVREGFTKTDAGAITAVTNLLDRGIISFNYALPDPENGKSYFGRGLVQLTFADNYKRLGQALGIGTALYDNPSLVLELQMSVKILFKGMIDGLFAAPHNLAKYFNTTTEDWEEARRIVNVKDKADLIAGYGRTFLKTLALKRDDTPFDTATIPKKAIGEPRIKFLGDTFLKQSIAQASALPDDQKQLISKGTILVLESFEDEISQHIKITFKDNLFKGLKTWFVFADHVDIFERETLTSTAAPASVEKPLSSKVALKVPYLSQIDNPVDPHKTCNVTCCAMVLKYYEIPRRKPEIAQFEDELLSFLEERGWSRYEHNKLAAMLEDYGIDDRFTTTASWKEVKQHLDQGNPVICAGQFTGSGHIIVISGYDETGFIVQDPNGEWFASGYVENSDAEPERGANQHYSYGMMDRLAGPSVWAHFVRKP